MLYIYIYTEYNKFIRTVLYLIENFIFIPMAKPTFQHHMILQKSFWYDAQEISYQCWKIVFWKTQNLFFKDSLMNRKLKKTHIFAFETFFNIINCFPVTWSSEYIFVEEVFIS